MMPMLVQEARRGMLKNMVLLIGMQWLLVLVVTASFTTIGSIETVAKLSDFGAFLMFALVNLAVIVLRYRTPSYHWHPGQFQMPFNIGRVPLLAGLGLASGQRHGD
jgi:amino acid transporter